MEGVARLLGLRYESKVQLGSGSSSEVWALQTATGKFVIRFLEPKNGLEPRIAFEAGLRRRLHSESVQVANVIATSDEFARVSKTRQWIVDEYLEGHIYPRGEIPDSVCAELAKVLGHVHAIAGRDYGRPKNSGEFKGLAATVETGLATRFDNPWPVGPMAIEQHPVSEAGRRSCEQMKRLEAEVFEHLQDSPSRVVHSDLHEGQIICSDGRLAGLIDFGDAMLADPAWDLASFYYFHGERALRSMLIAYEPCGVTRKLLERRARLFSLCIASHHAVRSQRLNKPHRLEAAIAHVKRVLQ